jgi:curved DNA-binding protein CbpA
MINYFKDCTNIDNIKNEYRKLAKKYHPDINTKSDDSIMKEINSQYDLAIKILKDTKSAKKADSQVQEAEIFKDIIAQLIKFDDIEIEICNWYLWISGNTKPIKELLKSLNFKWASKKKQWYYRPDWCFSRNRKEWSMEKIRSTYGSKNYSKNYSKNEKKMITI